ncbi:hypothetical protein HYX05_02680 [Candidatus Woesearchaeota archaeon]|nr:hypothetical protein [Candidatus Woesearchaeota archaeon]
MVKIKEVAIDKSPQWFYYVSILAAFLFTMYISIYSAIHFDSIRYMNIVVVFLFITIVSFFLISGVYFHTEKMGHHALAPVLFFAGMASLVIYAYKAVDASDMVRYSIIYTIVVAGISLFILLPKKRRKAEKAASKALEKNIKKVK